jgi:DNA invertase Pin-like site-specific DNA recombinase
MRAAIYARVSLDKNERSVGDQVALCERHAAKLGAHVVRVFADDGISGTSMANRPQVRELLAFARAGGCDVVIAEHTNRLARDGEDGWGIFKRLRALGVRYVTAEEGRVTTLTQAVSSMMSELKIEEAHHKTRRGMRGQVERGKNVTAPAYGYRRKRAYDPASGEPIRGLLEIHEPEAEVVRRIFREWVAGASAVAIAARLNAEGVAAPRGGLWCDTTIRGSPKIGKGVLFNELYRGVRVWGRREHFKDRETGGRVSRPVEDPADTIRSPAPELRIVDDELWAEANGRAADRARPGVGGRPRGAPARFLAGLMRCGVCGGTMTLGGPDTRVRCSNRALRGACSNPRTPVYATVEAYVLDRLRADLLHPDVIAHAVRTIQAETQAARKDMARRHARAREELTDVRRKAARLVDQVAEGVLTGPTVAGKLRDLEARALALESELAGPDGADVIALNPNAAGKYRAHVADLRAALEAPQGLEDREARAALRALVKAVVITPAPGRGKVTIDLQASLAPIFGAPEIDLLASAPKYSHLMR